MITVYVTSAAPGPTLLLPSLEYVHSNVTTIGILEMISSNVPRQGRDVDMCV
jgi:hypothetical protein